MTRFFPSLHRAENIRTVTIMMLGGLQTCDILLMGQRTAALPHPLTLKLKEYLLAIYSLEKNFLLSPTCNTSRYPFLALISSVEM